MDENPTYEELEKKVQGLEKEAAGHKRAEEALRKSEAKMRSIFRAAPIGIGIVSNRVIQGVNERFCDICGYSKDDLLGQSARIVYPSNEEYEYASTEDYHQIGKSGTGDVETQFKRKDGKIIDVLVSSSLIDTKDLSAGVTFTALDITKRKQAEVALRESGEKYRSVIENANIGIIVIQDGQRVFSNSKMPEIVGYTEEEYSNIDTMSLIHPEDRSYAIDRVKKRLEGIPIEPDLMEMRVLSKSGEIKWIEINSIVIQWEGRPAVQSFLTDISERKRAENMVRESEEKYRHLFEMESDVIILIRSEDGQILEINNAGSELYGYPREEFLKMKNTDLSAEPEETRRSTREGRIRVPLRYHLKKDGTVFPVEISGTKLNWKGQEARILTIRDISARIKAEGEKAKLEAQLRQAQKMEAIGTLAGGIAHDFNNILSPILVHSEMAMMELPPDNPIQLDLKQIFKAGERARDMVKQILAFSRQKEPEKIAIRMGFIIKEVLKLLRSSIPTAIDIRHNIKTDVDTIFADQTQIHQVILNLCTNASHAMREKGGILRLELDDLYLDFDAVGQSMVLNPGSYLRLTVSDTGQGIDPEVMNRIFEPYFTTKGPGEGTGMGLAAVHGIVRSHGGDITCESEPRKGTIFRVLFPRYEGEITEDSEGIVQLPRGTERILFVDDEKVAVDAIQPMFEYLGYKVTARTSSIEALEAFRNKPQGFDLVVTDMTMPNMTGEDLAKELMSIRPDIPIILCTGFSENMDERRAGEMGIKDFVMKPIVLREMANTIRKVLDKR